MKKVYLILMSCFAVSAITAQEVTQKIKNAFEKMMADQSMVHASAGFIVTDVISGKVIYSHDAGIGLAAASTQKIFTSIAAFELLGKSYRYHTDLSYEGKINNGMLTGNLVVSGSGDPTLGSWRWKETKPDTIFTAWNNALTDAGINRINGAIILESTGFSKQAIPGGWTWDDIGNYYGAGSHGINWKENQYDLLLQSGNVIGGPVKLTNGKAAPWNNRTFINELKAAPIGSGDNAYIYFPVDQTGAYVLKGTIPVNEKKFTISGASPDPQSDLEHELLNAWKKKITGKLSTKPAGTKKQLLQTWWSPPLDSINYWFLKKSINLYGEALLKTIAMEKTRHASTEEGVTLLVNFWKTKGIDTASLQVQDGSGLSPQNRVTARALVTALQYARAQSWFYSFEQALPLINQMKMKSGSIGGARSYAGYHMAADGSKYAFALLVNNYSGSSSRIVKLMWDVLDTLK